MVDFDIYPKYTNRLFWDDEERDYFGTRLGGAAPARAQGQARGGDSEPAPKMVYFSRGRPLRAAPTSRVVGSKSRSVSESKAIWRHRHRHSYGALGRIAKESDEALKERARQARDKRLTQCAPSQGYRKLRLCLERALMWSMAERLIAATGRE